MEGIVKMGMPILSSSSYEKKEHICSYNYERTRPKAPNPNPRNFRIKKVVTVGDLVVVAINYPGCTNYEGNKILIFDSITEEEIRDLIIIDPHFFPNKVSPIARFAPTQEGWVNAIDFAYCIKDKEGS